MQRFLFVGDSLTQQGFTPEHRGWIGQLSDSFARKADFVVRGFSGYNTAWVRAHLDMMAAGLWSPGFDVAFVLLGANDSATGPQYVPLADFKDNLAAIVKFLQGPRVEATRVVVLGVTPHDERAACYDAANPSKRTDDGHRRYCAAAGEVAAATGCDFVDLHAAVKAALGERWQTAFHDGLHLAAPGNDAVANAVRGALAAELAFPMALPDWKDLAAKVEAEEAAKAAAA